MGAIQSIYGLIRRHPFQEIQVPFKMALGKWKNRGAVLPEFEPKEALGGALDLHEGVPILRLRGTPFEIGVQHGTLLRNQIHFLTKRYLGIFAGWREHDMKLARRMEPRIPERFREEMRGVAEGAKIDYEDVLLTACFLDIHKVAACSTIVVRDQSSTTGEILFGRNLDFPALNVATHASVVMVIEPEGHTPFVNVAWPGFVGCISGVNSERLAMAMMLIYGHAFSDSIQGVPFAILYRQIMEECSTVAEALRFLEARRTIGDVANTNNMMLADKDHDAAVVEIHPKELGIIQDKSEFPLLRCTNHFRTGHRKFAFAFTFFSSFPRLWKLNKRKKQAAAMSVADIKEALAEVAIPGINLQRIIFYPERGDIEVGFGSVSRGPREYVYLDESKLLHCANSSLKESAPLS